MLILESKSGEVATVKLQNYTRRISSRLVLGVVHPPSSQTHYGHFRHANIRRRNGKASIAITSKYRRLWR